MMNSIEAVVIVAVMAYLVVVAHLLGSFINLAADRLPRRESVVRPRSHCRSCGRSLNLVDLIPVVGYLIRQGRCASCGVSIGAASPAIEALCGGSMLASLVFLGLARGAVVGFMAVVVVGVAAVSFAYSRRLGSRRGSRTGGAIGSGRPSQ